MTSIAAYVRISQDSSGERWGVETQRKKIADLAKLRGWTIVDWFEDNDTSASKPRGPKTDWARMLKDADAGRFGMVVAVDVDRLLRSTKDLNTLIDHHLKIVTVDGEIDLSTADGEFRATMLAGIAQFEARRKSERTKRSNARRRDEGMPVLSGKTPFGYTKDGTVIPEQEKAVKKAYDDFLSDPAVSIKRIADDLNEQGFVTARGTSWSTYAVRYMLANPLYAGFVKYYETGELYPVKGDKFPPIVSEDAWKASTGKLDDNQQKTTRRGNQPKYLLSGVAVCGRCGAKMVAGQNERRVPNYRCGAKFHVSRQREPVDVMVNEAMITRLSDKDVRDLVNKPKDDGIDREALRSERIARRARLKLVRPMLADPNQPIAEVQGAINDLQSRIAELDELLRDPSASSARSLVESTAGLEDEEERRAAVEQAWWALDVDRRRLIVDELVTVTIEPIKRGHVRFDPDLINIMPRSH